MDLFPAGDFIFVPCARVMDTLEQVEKLYTQAIIQDKTPLDEIQIICPVRKGMIGVYNINQVVREKLNPRVYPARRCYLPDRR